MLILASGSPRRKLILEQMNIPFTVESSNIDESTIEKQYTIINESRILANDPGLLVEALAKAKAESVLAKHTEATVIGSDTIVILDNLLLGKPHSEEDATHMLRMLSGKVHIVYTGVAILSANQTVVFHETAKVKFNELDSFQESVIAAYVASGASLDKAGSYGIQDEGASLVEEITGDYYTVMGLPFSRVRRELFNFGWKF